jgi:MFS family permease
VTVVLAGVGMYLLISLVTRLVQTPTSTGYGLGASIAVAGLVLLPFSVASVIANKLTPALIRRSSASLLLPFGSVIVLASMVLFAFARASLLQVIVLMGVAGFGIGCIFAVMPGLIIRSVPPRETGSATSFNQVLRYVGYAAGSTVSAVVLQARTVSGQTLPTGSGYTLAALIGCGVWVLTAGVSLWLPRLRMRTAPAAATPQADVTALTRSLGPSAQASTATSEDPAMAEPTGTV